MSADLIRAVLDEHQDYGLYAEYGGDTHHICMCDTTTKRPGTHRAHVAEVIAALLPESTETVEWRVRNISEGSNSFERTYPQISEASARSLGTGKNLVAESRTRTSYADTVTEWTEVTP